MNPKTFAKTLTCAVALAIALLPTTSEATVSLLGAGLVGLVNRRWRRS